MYLLSIHRPNGTLFLNELEFGGGEKIFGPKIRFAHNFVSNGVLEGWPLFCEVSIFENRQQTVEHFFQTTSPRG